MIARVSRDDALTPVTFVVRASRDEGGEVRGSITRVRTGESTPVRGDQRGGRVLTEMLEGDLGSSESRIGIRES